MTISESASRRTASQVTELRGSARAGQPVSAVSSADTSRWAGEEQSDAVQGHRSTSPFGRHCVFTDGWGA